MLKAKFMLIIVLRINNKNILNLSNVGTEVFNGIQLLIYNLERTVHKNYEMRIQSSGDSK